MCARGLKKKQSPAPQAIPLPDLMLFDENSLFILRAGTVSDPEKFLLQTASAFILFTAFTATPLFIALALLL
jgi:hypothetical protein